MSEVVKQEETENMNVNTESILRQLTELRASLNDRLLEYQHSAQELEPDILSARTRVSVAVSAREQAERALRRAESDRDSFREYLGPELPESTKSLRDQLFVLEADVTHARLAFDACEASEKKTRYELAELEKKAANLKEERKAVVQEWTEIDRRIAQLQVTAVLPR